jgi:hypothetical protein
MNRIFDALNSWPISVKNYYNCALSDRHVIAVNCVKDAVVFVNTWEVQQRSGRDAKYPPCFTGLKHTIVGVLLLWDDLRKERTVYFMTRQLSQDGLENTFSKTCAKKVDSTATRRHSVAGGFFSTC